MGDLRITSIGGDIQIVPLEPIVVAADELRFVLEHHDGWISVPFHQRKFAHQLQGLLNDAHLTAVTLRNPSPEATAVPAMIALKFLCDRAIEDLSGGKPVREEVAIAIRVRAGELRQAWAELQGVTDAVV